MNKGIMSEVRKLKRKSFIGTKPSPKRTRISPTQTKPSPTRTRVSPTQTKPSPTRTRVSLSPPIYLDRLETFINSPNYIDIQHLKSIKSNWIPYFIANQKMFYDSISASVDYLIEKYKHIRTVCNASLPIIQGSLIVHYKHSNQNIRLDIHDETIQQILKCVGIPNVELILLPVILVYDEKFLKNGENESHQCLLIVNCVLQTLEFFDPNGSENHIKILGNEIVHTLYNFLKRFNALKNYKGINLEDTVLQFGFQHFENQSTMFNELTVGGFCVAWSIFYAEIRIKYPKIPAKKLYKYYTPIFEEGDEEANIYLESNKSKYNLKSISDLFRRFIIDYIIHIEKYMRKYHTLRTEFEEKRIQLNKLAH